MRSKRDARLEENPISAESLRHPIESQKVRHSGIPSRRLTSRVEVSDGVWVYWRCDGREDVSRVRNLSLGGLFVQTSETRPIGVRANLHFLVQEGQIRADALVRHATSTSGLGLKFLAIKEADRPKLAALVTRLRSLLRSSC